MATKTFSDLRSAAAAIERDARARDRRVRTAVQKASRESRNYVIRETVPRAFGELAHSVHVVDAARGNSTVIADAPHAAAVENGSRPHTPPLEPLIAWVKLRGMQGLTGAGNVIKNRTRYGVIRDWRREASRVIAGALRAHESGGALGVDAPEQIARAIQRKIAREGTKPYRFMAQAVEPTRQFLDRFVKEALPDR